jgi:hypothetical protein
MEADVINRIPTIKLDITYSITHAMGTDAIHRIPTIKFMYLRIIQEFCVNLQIVFNFTEA